MPRTILVIAAHPDDEILGCGGTIAKHRQKGDTVHVVILAEGITSRKNDAAAGQVSQELGALAQAAQKANRLVGANSLVLHQFPDNRMDSLARLDVTQKVEAFVSQYKPDTVYTHHAGDVNIDHRRIHEAVVTACRPQPDHTVKTLLFFEVASSTEWQTPGSLPPFLPNWFEDISETLAVKLQALEAYETEMRDWPHARSLKALEHLARWRGATVGVQAAESFVLGRMLN